jgi:DNA polymerase elongation subunit (family B)
MFPDVEGDHVIQIGTVVQKFGEPNIFMKHIVTLGGCDNIDGAIVVPCKTEKEVLIEWTKFIHRLDPDIITGYNIFGFDNEIIFEPVLFK